MRVALELVLAGTVSLLMIACGGVAHREATPVAAVNTEDDVETLLRTVARLTHGQPLQSCGIGRLAHVPTQRRAYIAPMVVHLPEQVLEVMRLHAFAAFAVGGSIDEQPTFLYRVHSTREEVEQAFLAQNLLGVRFGDGRENECTQPICDMFELMRLEADWVDEGILRLRRGQRVDDVIAAEEGAQVASAPSSIRCTEVAAFDPDALFVLTSEGRDEQPRTVQRMRLVPEGLLNEYRIGDSAEWVNAQVLPDEALRAAQERFAREVAIAAQMRSDGPGILPVADVDVTDDTQFRVQVGLRERPATARPGEVLELYRRRVRARPQDVGVLMILLQALADATQWDEALDVVRAVEAALPSEMASVLAGTARQIAFHASEEEWQARLLRDGVGTATNIRELMGSIRTVEDLIDDKRISYVSAEDLVRTDFAIRDEAASVRRVRLATPERFPKDGVIGALFALINPGVPGEEAEDNHGLVIRARGQALAPRVLSDDAFARGVIEFADGSAHLLAESFVAAGAWTANFARFARDFSDGPIELDVALRNDDARRSVRVLFVLEGELRGNEIVFSRVSENVRTLPWALVRRYAAAPFAAWEANAESEDHRVELEARNEADATALLAELAAHECTCQRNGLRVTCRDANDQAPFAALATALAERLPTDTRASLLAPR